IKIWNFVGSFRSEYFEEGKKGERVKGERGRGSSRGCLAKISGSPEKKKKERPGCAATVATGLAGMD
ncbi:hypothetical protein HAX54_001775, partial [Datura stramonium]|nr:hypothetical protein [Datura stramonium]